jgi:hypothetical protein
MLPAMPLSLDITCFEQKSLQKKQTFSEELYNGMSWSKQGSVALATITAMHVNNEHKNWCCKNKLDFRLTA